MAIQLLRPGGNGTDGLPSARIRASPKIGARSANSAARAAPAPARNAGHFAEYPDQAHMSAAPRAPHAAIDPADSRRTGRAAGNPRRRHSATDSAQNAEIAADRANQPRTGRRHVQKIGKSVRGVRHAAAHGVAAFDEHDVGRSAGGRRNRLAASTVPENPAPTITKVFRILWKFYQAKPARRPCGKGILRLTFGRIRGQIAQFIRARCNDATQQIQLLLRFRGLSDHGGRADGRQILATLPGMADGNGYCACLAGLVLWTLAGIRAAPDCVASHAGVLAHAQSAPRRAAGPDRHAVMGQRDSLAQRHFAAVLVVGGLQRGQWPDGGRDDSAIGGMAMCIT